MGCGILIFNKMKMKKIIVFVFVSLFQFIYAQEELILPNLKTVRWGISAGLNYDHLSGKDMTYIFNKETSNYKAGFHAGVFVSNQVGKYFALKHELVFTQKRMGVELNDHQGEAYASTLTTNYINLNPVNLTFTIKGFHVFAGPYVGALIGANLQRKDADGVMFKDKSIYGGSDDDESDHKYLQKFDFGVQAGLEYHFKFKLFLGARFSQGLIPLFQYASSNDSGVKKDRINIQNQGVNFTIGYSF